MDPLLILLAGMVVVIGGILWLKLHAFLALISGAFVVSMLTPSTDIFERQVRRDGWQIESTLSRDRFAIAQRLSSEEMRPGRYDGVRLFPDERPTQLGQVDLRPSADGVRIVYRNGTDEATFAAGDWLIEIRDYQAAVTLRDSNWANRIAAGFGSTCAKIGILIALASVIGNCLLDSGAARRIVSAMCDALGERRTPIALVLSGFVIGIPVYFDTVFFLLLPLARALGKQTGRNYLLYILSIVVGATMAHSLVPPTPGPLLVASELGVSLGQMIVAGTIVGLVAASAGYVFALWANRRWTISIPTLEADQIAGRSISLSDTKEKAPPLGLALIPIALPVVLLSVGTFLVADSGSGSDLGADPDRGIRHLFAILSDKNIALGLAAIAAIFMLVRYAPKEVDWTRSVQQALLSAGNIVLITAAGGAFGHVLRQSGIAEAIQHRFPITQAGLGLLIIAFVITAVVRVAQGSATVAMITAVGIVAPLVQDAMLPFPTVFVALAIGCGSKPLPWMNDSGFWVITRMSGMTESESLRTFSIALTLMGFVGLAVTLFGAAMFGR